MIDEQSAEAATDDVDLVGERGATDRFDVPVEGEVCEAAFGLAGPSNGVVQPVCRNGAAQR